MPKFEVFERRSVPVSREPRVTVQKRGVVSFNTAAYNLLDQPAAIQFLYDPDDKIVGFRGATESDANSYLLRPVGGKGSGRSTFLTSGKAFFEYYEIKTEVARRWDAFIADGVLCIDMKEPGLEVVGNRRPREIPAEDFDSQHEGSGSRNVCRPGSPNSVRGGGS